MPFHIIVPSQQIACKMQENVSAAVQKGGVWYYILSSREDPKIRRRDDAEVVGYLIAVAVPVSWHVLAQEGQDRTAEVSECGMAPVVCDVPVHQAP